MLGRLNRDTLRSIVLATMPFAGLKADANEALAFTRQLEHVFSKTYDFEYPDSIGRKIVPIDTSVSPGAESHVYRMFDDVGEAELIEHYADDLPMVDAFGQEFAGKVVGLGNSFYVTIQDLRRAVLLNMNIDDRKAKAARKMMERKLDQMLATGNAKVSLTGIANNANVPVVVPTTGAWTNPATTASQIQTDIEGLCKAVYVNTKGVHGNPDNGSQLTIAMPVAQYARIMTTRLDNFNMVTLREYLLAHLPMVKDIVGWGRLDLADAEGDGPRAIAFHKDDDVVSGILPQDFEIFPPQYRNLGYMVPCHMRFGGVIVRFPKAMAYMDGI